MNGKHVFVVPIICNKKYEAYKDAIKNGPYLNVIKIDRQNENDKYLYVN